MTTRSPKRGARFGSPLGQTWINRWLGPESNRRHADFQSAALPTELPSRKESARRAERVTKAENLQRSTSNVQSKTFAAIRSPDATSSGNAHAESRSPRTAANGA